MDAAADNIALATEITVAWLSNPSTRVEVDDIPKFLASVNEALSKLGTSPLEEAQADNAASVEYQRAVSLRKSLADPEYIVSMIDGKKYRSLKRHLGSHGLSPDEYRQRYGLQDSYPMTAPAYSQARREVAKRLGLGRKPGTKVKKAAHQEKSAPKGR